MKLLLVILLLLTALGTVSGQTCVPGERDVDHNGRILHNAWVTCVDTEYNSLNGYLPIGANVEFELAGMVRAGEINHYQFTAYPEQWPEGSRKPMVYMVNYDGGTIALTPEELLPR